MPILNQVDTGMPCPQEINVLKRAIDNRGNASMMMYISVHVFTLAKVLDRLEYLERYEKFVKDSLSKGIPYK